MTTEYFLFQNGLEMAKTTLQATVNHTTSRTPGDGKWKKKILEDDENSTFDSLDIRRVRPSGCDKLFKVKEAYDLTRW